jgi:hypothetical protein
MTKSVGCRVASAEGYGKVNFRDYDWFQKWIKECSLQTTIKIMSSFSIEALCSSHAAKG